MDLVDAASLLKKVIDLEDLPSFNLKFEQAGYDTTIFLRELGPLVLIIVGGLLFIILRAITKLIVLMICGRHPADGHGNCLSRRLRSDSEARVAILRFLLEGCLEIGISAMICVLSIYKDDKFDDTNETISTSFAFFALACLVLAPFGLICRACTYRRAIKAEREVDSHAIVDDAFFRDFKTDKYS